VFPETKEQRCWFHKTANVLNALPRSAHPGAKAALAEIYNAEDAEHARTAVTAFERDFGAKWPKAVAKITEDLDVLLEFYTYPAEHWVHLRATNPIESTFATVRLRQRITKGTQWQEEAAAFGTRSLAGTDYVYVWVDGIHLKVHLQQDKVCLLVMIGVRADGRKELIALADGFRESTESWADLLRSARRRGMAAPVLAVGDGALGFWAAVREVFPETKEQRCWFHKTANVLNALPRSAHPGAKAALAEIYNAEDAEHARTAVTAFERDFGAKWPKAVAKITEDLDVLLEFYTYPAEHWVHLRTTNPIESTFATVRLRQRITKGPGSRAAGVAMAFKLIESAQQRWRAVNAPHLVPLVRAGAQFEKGKLVERPGDQGGEQQVA